MWRNSFQIWFRLWQLAKTMVKTLWSLIAPAVRSSAQSIVQSLKWGMWSRFWMVCHWRVFWANWRGFLCFFCRLLMLETIHIILLAVGPRSKAQSPTFPTRSLSLSMVLWRGHLPLTRLRGKTSPPQQSKTRHQTLRAAAVKEGLAPKARKAFALYVMDKSQVKAGAGRDAFALEMRRLGREWAALPSSLKAHYRERSATEFQCQRDALLRAGIKVRAGLTSKLPSPVQQMEKNHGKKITVGPYTVVVEASGEDENAGWTVLGSGSYGTSWQLPRKDNHVQWKFLVAGMQPRGTIWGRPVEVLGIPQCLWQPMVPSPSRSQPQCGTVAMDVIVLWGGPLAPKHFQAFVSQLECALRVLHKKAGLVHLDIKPSNILWRAELNCLKVCDFGMAERWQSASGLLNSEPRFEQYVTSWYRPPELWQLDGRIASLQKALTSWVDVWSFGCVVFEAGGGAVLMRPMKGSSCPSKTIASWCKNWPNLRLDAQGKAKPNSCEYNHFMSRLQRLSNSLWRKVVLSACVLLTLWSDTGSEGAKNNNNSYSVQGSDFRLESKVQSPEWRKIILALGFHQQSVVQSPEWIV